MCLSGIKKTSKFSNYFQCSLISSHCALLSWALCSQQLPRWACAAAHLHYCFSHWKSPCPSFLLVSFQGFNRSFRLCHFPSLDNLTVSHLASYLSPCSFLHISHCLGTVPGANFQGSKPRKFSDIAHWTVWYWIKVHPNFAGIPFTLEDVGCRGRGEGKGQLDHFPVVVTCHCEWWQRLLISMHWWLAREDCSPAVSGNLGNCWHGGVFSPAELKHPRYWIGLRLGLGR